MTPSRFYLPQLDGLRFLAFAAVFVCHVGATVTRWKGNPWWQAVLDAGALGVDLFFVLSSFLITALLLREKDQRGTLGVRAFWMRRILRIWPLYFTALALAALITEPPWSYLLLFTIFLGNWRLTRGEDGYPTDLLWSVSIEEQFYLCWPVVVRSLRPIQIAGLCLGLTALAVGIRLLLTAEGGRSYPIVWYNTFARLDPIAIGAVAALLWRWRPFSLPSGARPVVLLAVTGVLVVMAWRRPFFTAPLQADAAVIYLIVAILLGASVLVTVATPRGLLGHPILIYLGRISYGLYVVHVAAMQIVGAFELPWLWRIPLTIGLTLGLAALSYWILEEPFLRLKERFTYVRSAPVWVDRSA